MQQLVARILSELDAIDRFQQQGPGPDALDGINEAKLRIVQNLLALATAASLSYTLPKDLTEDAFFTREEADQPPPAAGLQH